MNPPRGREAAQTLKAIAVPFTLLAAGALCSRAVLPADAGFLVVVGALAWGLALVVGIHALTVVALVSLPFTLLRWLRGRRDDEAAAARRDRRFVTVYPIAVALWCGATGLALGFVPAGWGPGAALALHAGVAAVLGWLQRWVVATRYGVESDAGPDTARVAESSRAD